AALDEDMGRAADRTPFAAKEDVAVAAHAGIAGPLVAGQADEAAGRVELRGQPVELFPERVGDLEIVALMADDVDEGLVARSGNSFPPSPCRWSRRSDRARRPSSA